MLCTQLCRSLFNEESPNEETGNRLKEQRIQSENYRKPMLAGINEAITNAAKEEKTGFEDFFEYSLR